MIELCGINCITDIIVADINTDAIIRLDFLKSINCQLDMANDILKMKDKSCKLKFAGKVGNYRITVQNL